MHSVAKIKKMIRKLHVHAIYYLCREKNFFMKYNRIFSFVISTLLMWAICYLFNTTATVGKIVFSTAFINPWNTYTTVKYYMYAGMGMTEGLAYTMAAVLLIFLWVALYYFLYSVKCAIDTKPYRR